MVDTMSIGKTYLSSTIFPDGDLKMATSKQHVKGMKRKKKFKERIGQRKKKKLDVHNEIKELEEAYKLVSANVVICENS